MSHDQNFKNLILDYPRDAHAFFPPDEAADALPGSKIVPVRQEQLKGRLKDCFRELDVPLLVQWPNGRREVLLFMVIAGFRIKAPRPTPGPPRLPARQAE